MPLATSTTTRTFIGLRCAKSGALVRLREHNDFVTSWFEFSRDPSYPVYDAPNEDALAFALAEDTPSYNANRKSPGWGPFKREDLVPVRVTVTEDIEDIELKEPVSIEKTIEKRLIPARVASRYAGRTLSTMEPVNFWLVEIPEGQTLESLKANEGSVIYGSSKYFKHRIFCACEVPEDYVEQAPHAPRALLLVSEEMPYTE